jgi:predicted tellurium resistance membrane protein TerC
MVLLFDASCTSTLCCSNTQNPLVVFSSNIFAIMGLRSLYTILAQAASELKYLEPAVAVILGFIGVKLVLEYFGINIPTEYSLGVVLSLLGVGIAASVYETKQLEQVEEQATENKL